MNWTAAEESIIRDNWRAMTDLQLCDMLPGRSITAIHMRRAVRLGLNRRIPESAYAPVFRDRSIYHGALPDNPISREFIAAIDDMRGRAGTYNDGRRFGCT